MKKVLVLIIDLALISILQAQVSDSLVLYCTFDDVHSITHPVKGPGGTFQADSTANFTEGISGNAYIAGNGQNFLVTYPKEVITAYRGCVEFWARVTNYSNWKHYTFFATGSESPGSIVRYSLGLTPDNGFGGGGLASSAGASHDGNAEGSAASGPSWYYYSFYKFIGNEHDWHHYALAWDSGSVPGSIWRMQMFVDGHFHGSCIYNWEGSNYDPDSLVALTAGAFNVLSTEEGTTLAIDELKIWNYACTAFSRNPYIVAVLDDQLACRSDSIAFRALAAGSLPVSYQWQKDGIDIPDAYDTSLIFQDLRPEDAGEYRCIATNAFGSDTSNTASLSIEFKDPSTILGATTSRQYAVETYSVTATEGHWYEFHVHGGIPVANTGNSITVQWIANTSGRVAVIEHSEIGCVADSVFLNVTIGNLGIADPLQLPVCFYPNPVSGSANFAFTLDNPSCVEIKIYNSYGLAVAEPVNGLLGSGEQRIVWNTGSLLPGFYYYRVNMAGRISSGKIVIMN